MGGTAGEGLPWISDTDAADAGGGWGPPQPVAHTVQAFSAESGTAGGGGPCLPIAAGVSPGPDVSPHADVCRMAMVTKSRFRSEERRGGFHPRAAGAAVGTGGRGPHVLRLPPVSAVSDWPFRGQ